MAETPSTMLELGTELPTFDLPNMNQANGPEQVSSLDYQNQALVVAFICNHCPYVVLIKDQLARLAAEWQQAGVKLVAISSNDIEHYPADSPQRMTDFARVNKFEFPYLYDESQQVAKSYRAACTPDFYLFDANHRLVYRGQFDSARPGNGQTVTGEDLNAAVQALIDGKFVATHQIASVGCNIKWKAGNHPDYF